jgi:hypothetical protein
MKSCVPGHPFVQVWDWIAYKEFSKWAMMLLRLVEKSLTKTEGEQLLNGAW